MKNPITVYSIDAQRASQKKGLVFVFFPTIWVKEPRHSENISDEKCYTTSLVVARVPNPFLPEGSIYIAAFGTQCGCSLDPGWLVSSALLLCFACSIIYSVSYGGGDDDDGGIGKTVVRNSAQVIDHVAVCSYSYVLQQQQ